MVQHGFTLIEVLVVSAILVLLMSVVLVAVNPFRMFAASQQTKRSADVNVLGKALDQYLISAKGVIPAALLPLSTPKPVAKGTGGAEADICGLLADQIAGLPTDPNSTSSVVRDCAAAYNTGYNVVANASGKIGCILQPGSRSPTPQV